MIFKNKKDFLSSIPKNTKIAGLDVGEKTIGIAICDETRSITTPKTIIKRKGNSKDIPELLNLLSGYNIQGIIIGLPLNLKDEETDMSTFIRRFGTNLAKETDLPIFFFDEKCSSLMAKDFMISKMGTKFQKTRQLVDKVAASFILQSFLESTHKNSCG